MTRVVLPPRRPESGGLMAEVDDRALTDGHGRSRAVNQGSSGSALTSPFGLRTGPALPFDRAFQVTWAALPKSADPDVGITPGKNDVNELARQGGRRCLCKLRG
jgi:hypothetical protein